MIHYNYIDLQLYKTVCRGKMRLLTQPQQVILFAEYIPIRIKL